MLLPLNWTVLRQLRRGVTIYGFDEKKIIIIKYSLLSRALEVYLCILIASLQIDILKMEKKILSDIWCNIFG